MVRRNRMPRRGSRRLPRGVNALLGDEATLLIASALGSGLASARPRSSPDRLERESRRYAALLSTLSTPGRKDFPGLAQAELAVGFLAGSSPEEADQVLGIWRRAFASVATGWDSAERRSQLETALSRFEEAARAGAEAREAGRLELIAIGASAGGVVALGSLLGRLEADLPLSLLIVIHLSSKSPSMLPAVLSRESPLHIAYALEGGIPQLGFAYIAPSGSHLVVKEGRFHLMDGPPVHFVKPSIDVLLESAAEAYGPRMASVILSGTGVDGAAGTRAVHERGGLTLVQDPASAEFRGMPEAALATQAVDRKMPLAALAATIQRLARQGRQAKR